MPPAGEQRRDVQAVRAQVRRLLLQQGVPGAIRPPEATSTYLWPPFVRCYLWAFISFKWSCVSESLLFAACGLSEVPPVKGFLEVVGARNAAQPLA